jgi:hypothetical protein
MRFGHGVDHQQVRRLIDDVITPALRDRERLEAVLRGARPDTWTLVSGERLLLLEASDRRRVLTTTCFLIDLQRLKEVEDDAGPALLLELDEGDQIVAQLATIEDGAVLTTALHEGVSEARRVLEDSTMLPGPRRPPGLVERLGGDRFWLTIDRAEVEARQMTRVLNVLETVLSGPAFARRMHGRVMVSISGYDDDPRELHEVPQVRRYLRQLDYAFPHWVFFLHPSASGWFEAVMRCHLPAFIPSGEEAAVLAQLNEMLRDWWFPHFVSVGEWAGLREDELVNHWDLFCHTP